MVERVCVWRERVLATHANATVLPRQLCTWRVLTAQQRSGCHSLSWLAIWPVLRRPRCSSHAPTPCSTRCARAPGARLTPPYPSPGSTRRDMSVSRLFTRPCWTAATCCSSAVLLRHHPQSRPPTASPLALSLENPNSSRGPFRRGDSRYCSPAWVRTTA